MNKHDDFDELLIQDLEDIHRKKESIRKTYLETQEMVEGFERSRRKRLRTWSVSAVSAAACIAAFIIFFLPSFRNSTGDELFESYYQRYSVNLDTRADGQKPELGQAIEYYQTGRNTEALKKLESMFIEDKSNPEYLFYKALFLLDAGEYKTAYDGFQSLLDLGGTYQWHARWYMALIDIQESNFQSGREHQKKLRKAPDSLYRKKAYRLNRKIRFRR